MSEALTEAKLDRAKRHARANVTDFTLWTFPAYVEDPFHRLVGDYLTMLVAGTIDALMILAPPQHGKSELCSIRLPAYWLGQYPDSPIILGSYEAELAQAKSKEARALVESEEYVELFPGLPLDSATQAGGLWKLAGHKGQMRAAGVGGGFTGHGAGIGIIDDPVKSWKEALSPTFRETAWGWYLSSFRTRLAEMGRRLLIMTRWNHDDLGGRILKSEGVWPKGKWHVLRLPALAESQEERDENNKLLGMAGGLPDPLGRQEGEALAPRRYSAETLEAIKVDVGPSVWAALYQGTPRPEEGRLFDVEKLDYVDVLPEGIRWVRFWDLAASTKKLADRTSGAKVGILGGRVFVGSMRFGRFAPQVLEGQIVSCAELDGRKVPIVVEREPGASGEIVINRFARMLHGYVVKGDPASGDKVLRAQPFAAQVAAGNVTFLRASWNHEAVDEMAVAPFGGHDDLWDSMVGGYNYLIRRPASTRRMIDLWGSQPPEPMAHEAANAQGDPGTAEDAERMLREYEAT